MPSLQDACVGQYQACVVRATRLGPTCTPLTGPNNSVVTAALVTLDATYQVEAGQEFGPLNGCGDRIWRVQDQDDIQQLNLTLSMAVWDFELLEILTGGTLIQNAGKVVGMADRGPNAGTFIGAALEVFTKTALGQGEVCAASGATVLPYGRHLYPRAVLRLDSWQHGNATDGLLCNLTGFSVPNPAWLKGPASDWPVNLPASAPHAQILTSTLPTVGCGYTS